MLDIGKIPKGDKMKHYELMFIVKPTLTDEESQSKFDEIQNIIKAGNGEIVAPVDYGVRRLAYPIEKQKRGHYYLVYFKADGHVNKELERVFGITEDIIRFMILKYEKKSEIINWDKMVAKVTTPAPVKEATSQTSEQKSAE